MELETIRMQLSQLRLPTAAKELQDVLSKQKKAVTLGWVSALLEREIDARRESSLKARLSRRQSFRRSKPGRPSILCSTHASTSRDFRNSSHWPSFATIRLSSFWDRQEPANPILRRPSESLPFTMGIAFIGRQRKNFNAKSLRPNLETIWMISSERSSPPNSGSMTILVS